MNSCIYFMVALSFLEKLTCTQNNVCPTFEDYSTIRNNSRCWYDFAANSSVIQIIKGNGYPVETHKVVTPDGYILTVFRIPNYWFHTEHLISRRKGPVFLQHGWMNSAAIFVSRGRDSLAFALADAGYDVWLGNFRGSQYSEEHVNLTTSDKEYWDYSADEIGLFDVPAQLELVAERTRERRSIIYIGHSLGTTGALIYGSSYPALAKETVKLFVLLAPAANLSHMKSLVFRVFGRLFGSILRLANNIQFVRLISHYQPMKNFAQTICMESPTLMRLCTQAINLLVNGPHTQTEPSMLPVIFNQLPAGTSFKVTKQIADFSRNSFGRYNYGLRNFLKYGNIFPPKYEVGKVEVPVFIMYAVNDWACTKEDSLMLYDQLSPKVRYGIHEISETNFNHWDFCFGKNVKTLVNDQILNLLTATNINSV